MPGRMLVHGDYPLWVKGQILEERIKIGHDAPRGRRPAQALNYQGLDELSDDRKTPRDEQGTFALTPRGKIYRFVDLSIYRFVEVIFATKSPNGLWDCLARSLYSMPIFRDSVTKVS